MSTSTGALSKEAHEAQDKRYAEGHEYDVAIVGSGVASLTFAALMAHAGKKVCILEAHDIPGGYAHSFQMGDYFFCAQIHYIWGCAPGGVVYEFLKKIGLEEDITFEPYDPNGYDHMVMPDGKEVAIPCGYDQLVKNVEEAYPGQGTPTQKFVDVLESIRAALRHFPSHRKLRFSDYILKGWRFLPLLKYEHKTVQDVFDACGLSKEAQAVLIAQAGDMMEPPERLSIFAFCGLFGGYNTGAYYPTKHFKYVIDRLTQFITDQEGCHIYYETPVIKIHTEGNKVTSFECKDGKTFTAKQYVCNADPQQSAKHLIGWDKIPEKFRPALSYEYSPSGLVMYLGLKDIDLKKYGFGSYNFWHCTQWDMNKTWKEQLHGNFEKPWFFISTATMHTPEGGVAPEGREIMEIATVADYGAYKKLKDQDPKVYRQKKMELAEQLLDLVEEHYIPDLRKHIELKVVGTSVTNEHYVNAPKGNAYGSALTPKNVSRGRLKAGTPFENFFWCNASSGYAGFHGTTYTGVSLYEKLMDDPFFNSQEYPSDEELIAYARQQWEERHAKN